MIHILNRKQLYSTFNLQERSSINQILEQNHIEYYTKVINRKSSSPFSSGSRVRTGTFGENTNLEYEYIIFVKKTDFQEANILIK